MHKEVDFIKIGGAHIFQETLDFMQSGYSEPLSGLASFLGDKVVVSGVLDNGISVTDGWITYNSGFIPFVGGVKTATVVVSNNTQDEGFDDNTTKPFYINKYAQFGNAGGFPYSDLKRFPESELFQSIYNIRRVLESVVMLEPEVIISGCAVTNVNIGASTLSIGAGIVMFDSKFVASPSYSGTYPVFLKTDGSWVNQQPVGGGFIKFDPYTSQHYVNVVDRAITPIGRILMEETLTDRFDSNGIGRWEMKGYRLMDMQGRFPVGYWYDAIPVNGVTDGAYQTPGSIGGTNGHVVTNNNIQAFDVSKPGSAATGGVGNPVAGDQSNDGVVAYKIGVDNPTKIDHRPPFKVVVFIKRTA